MHAFLLPVLVSLFIGILLMVILTVKYGVHAFFALLISCFVVGLGVHMPVTDILSAVKEGFGNIMKSIGLIIVFGTTLGVILEHTGSTQVMAGYILKKVGEKRASLAMNLTGLLVGLPIFCDAGFIVLSGLNKSLARRTGIPVSVMAVSLATGLYSIHCLVPPHPGVAAAAGLFSVDFGRLILAGSGIAVPAAFAGYLWANYAGKKNPVFAAPEDLAVISPVAALPRVFNAFLPVAVPIILIAFRSFLSIEAEPVGWRAVFFSLGDPVIALAIGVLLAFTAGPSGKKSGLPRSASGDREVPFWNKTTISILLRDAAEKAGGILVIIGAGGAFGAVLTATRLGEQLSASMPLGSLGLLFPFLLTAILKTALGSSTVAIITAASIIHPLLPALGLAGPNGQWLCILAMGAGSMMLSHANDAYFWVVAKFAGLDMRTMLRVHTVASFFMGVTAFVLVFVLSLMVK